VRPGVTTDELDRIVHETIVEGGGYPSPLNYYSFPKSVCTSVNEARPSCFSSLMLVSS
jgi:methionyl aminopeptidase